jgi:hypothetical protein
MKDLIVNAFDMHVHSGPDVLPRRVTDVDMARRLIEAGMNGYIIKSHYFNSAERASLMREIFPKCNVRGAIAMNSSIGGLNPVAVQLAVMSGIKLIWFPTSDAKHEQEAMFGDNAPPPEKLPFWAKVVAEMREKKINCPPVSVFKEDGSLKGEVYDILDIAARYNVVVATGHLSHPETFAVAKAAKERGVNKLLITHVTFPTTFYTVAEQKELLEYGAYMEHCYTTYASGKVEFDVIADQIRAIGPDHVVISTDLGQPKGIYPDDGMLQFAKDLIAKGFTDREIHIMNGENPRILVDAN